MRRPCRRCHTFGPTKSYSNGLLWLCDACFVASATCPEFQHCYHASTKEGLWVCVMCGTHLGSQYISTEPVPATS
jgi:hypothetical protein